MIICKNLKPFSLILSLDELKKKCQHNGKQEIIHNGDLVGPFTFPGNEYIPTDVELWVGKYDVKL